MNKMHLYRKKCGPLQNMEGKREKIFFTWNRKESMKSKYILERRTRKRGNRKEKERKKKGKRPHDVKKAKK